MTGDVHIHTRRSDGALTPERALVVARERGLGYVSFTDHDTVSGIEPLIAKGIGFGLTVIPGVEVSCVRSDSGSPVHVLGYGFKLPARSIEQLCQPIRRMRLESSLQQIDVLQAAGYPVDLAGVRGVARGDVSCELSPDCRGAGWPPDPLIYRHHIMSALVEAGCAEALYGPLRQELFGAGGICHAAHFGADPADAIRAIKEDGGVAVLAHPVVSGVLDLVPRLVDAGLDGLEMVHPYHDLDAQRRIADTARTHGLFLTGGSDDHGLFGDLVGDGGIATETTVACFVAPEGTLEQLTAVGDEEVRFAVRVAREAGRIARAAAATDVDTRLKGGDIRDLVTEHDIAVERYITEQIRRRCPGDKFITEEADHTEPDHDAAVWIIDPIDGTTNFVSCGSYFAVSIAKYRGRRPEFGVVYDVMADEVYVGLAGHGAYLNGQPLPAPWGGSPKSPSECVVELSMAAHRRLAGDSLDDQTRRVLRSTRTQRSLGSAALGICRVARGTLDAYVSSSLSIWDYAAAVIVLTEAGGAFSLHQAEDERPPEDQIVIHLDRRPIAASGHSSTLAELIDLLTPHSDSPASSAAGPTAVTLKPLLRSNHLDHNR